MKKLMFLMMALLVAPALADVTISVVDNGDLTAHIVVTADGDDLNVGGDSLVAGIGLDLSVDVGEIVAVTPFLTTGESIDGGEGYGIFMGTITFTGGDPEEILDVGTPVAPATAPDNPGQLPGPACVVELGCLYNVNTPEAAPLATTILCTVEVSEEATLTLGENATRGGVVLIGGGAPSAMDPSTWHGPVTGGVVRDYVGPDQAAYDEYIAAGFTDEGMAGWATPYQCDGDINGITETIFNYRVYMGDLDALVQNWKKKISDPTLDAAADIDHSSETIFNYRVYMGDLSTLVDNWKKKDAGLAGTCNNP